jgi:pimeloyl-ACP methyl ester carboxylesterase
VVDTRVMDLPDRRELAWLELGKPKGPSVFVFHGTPGSRLQVSFDEKTIASSGVRFIAIDRPGYGHSTYQRGRRLVDWASDVACLADHLKISQFAVAGVSGGGPHAAVCARFLSDRVTGAAIVSGVGPFADSGLEGGDMIGINRTITRLAAASPSMLVPLFAAQEFIMRHWPEPALRAALRQFPDADAAVLRRDDVHAAFLEDARRTAPTAARAAAQDFAIFASDWGFRLEEITVPVHVWHGDADRNVPFSHGRYQAATIPGAVLHECPGEGHLLVVDHLAEILRTVGGTSRASDTTDPECV